MPTKGHLKILIIIIIARYSYQCEIIIFIRVLRILRNIYFRFILILLFSQIENFKVVIILNIFFPFVFKVGIILYFVHK